MLHKGTKSGRKWITNKEGGRREGDCFKYFFWFHFLSLSLSLSLYFLFFVFIFILLCFFFIFYEMYSLLSNSFSFCRLPVSVGSGLFRLKKPHFHRMRMRRTSSKIPATTLTMMIQSGTAGVSPVSSRSGYAIVSAFNR